MGLDELRQKITFRKIIGFFSAVAIIGVVVLFQLIVADFSIDAFRSPDFYIRIAYRVVLIVLVYHCIINLLYDKQLRSQRVQDARTKYIAAVKMKDITFKDFLKEYNYNLKTEAWTNKIDKKINKINRKLESGRNVEKYTSKVLYLEKLKSPEYIEKNWAYLNCKWTQVYTGDFSVEDAYSNSEKRARSQFNADVAKMSLRRISMYVFWSLVLGLVVVNMAFDGVKTAAFWFNMLVDIVLVLMRAADAGFQLPILIDCNFTDVYLYKVDVMQQYVEWCATNNITESKAYKVLSYIQDVEVEKNTEPEIKEDKE